MLGSKTGARTTGIVYKSITLVVRESRSPHLRQFLVFVWETVDGVVEHFLHQTFLIICYLKNNHISICSYLFQISAQSHFLHPEHVQIFQHAQAHTRTLGCWAVHKRQMGRGFFFRTLLAGKLQPPRTGAGRWTPSSIWCCNHQNVSLICVIM